MEFLLALIVSAVAMAQTSPATAAPSGSAVIKMYDQGGIDKWADCAWKRVPKSTENWLNAVDDKLVTAKPSANPMASPKSVLALRLDAACGELLSPSDRNSISFGVQRAKAMTLRKLRPLQNAASSEATSKATVCEISSQGMLIMTILSAEGEKPKRQSGVQMRCFSTADDGSLIASK